MEALKEVGEVFGSVMLVLVVGGALVAGGARSLMFLFGVENN